MSNSPPSPGPDLFFAGGECLTRFGVWVRRTDMDLEAATDEDATRNSDGSAFGRDGILRTWGVDEPRAEWLNEVELDPTRNLLEFTDMRLWNTAENADVEDSDRAGPLPGVPVTECIDPSDTTLARVTSPSIAPQFAASVQYTASVYVRRGPPGTPTANLRLRFAGGVTEQWDLNYDPVNDVIEVFGPTPEASGMENLDGGYRRIWIQETDDGIRLADVWTYPAWRASGTGGTEAAATGSNFMSAPQLEIGPGPPTKFQEIPRDTDRKFPSLLLERQKTNNVLWSEELDTGAVWLLARATISPNGNTAPDGTVTMDKIVEDATAANTHYIRQVLQATPADNSALAFSVYAAQSSRTTVQVSIIRKDTSESRAIFNIQDNDIPVGERIGFQTGLISAEIQRAGPFQFRCTVVADVLSGGTDPEVRVNLTDGLESSDNVYDGDGTSGIWAWGAQAEYVAPQSSSYIKTTNPTVSRESDIVEAAFMAPPVVMTAYAKFIESGSLKTSNARVYQIGASGSGAPYFRILSANQTTYRCTHDGGDGSVSSTTSNASAPAFGDLVELVGFLFEDGSVQIGIAINGSRVELAGRSEGTTVAAAWSDQIVNLNGVNGTDVGLTRLLALKMHRGTRSLDFMRSL